MPIGSCPSAYRRVPVYLVSFPVEFVFPSYLDGAYWGFRRVQKQVDLFPRKEDFGVLSGRKGPVGVLFSGLYSGVDLTVVRSFPRVFGLRFFPLIGTF